MQAFLILIAARSHPDRRAASFRAKFERYVAVDRADPDLRRKAFTAITAKMARVVHAVIKGEEPLSIGAVGAPWRPRR
jgi:hypothetical protein